MDQLIDDYIRGADMDNRFIAAAMDCCILLEERSGPRYKEIREAVLKNEIPKGSYWFRIGRNIFKNSADHSFNPVDVKAKEMYSPGPEPKQHTLFSKEEVVMRSNLEMFVEMVVEELQEIKRWKK